MLSEKQQTMINRIETLKKKVELLESHRVVYGESLISPKQYNETTRQILKELEELEHENGIFEDNSLNKKFNDLYRQLTAIERELEKLLIAMDNENYDLAVKMAINGIFEESKC